MQFTYSHSKHIGEAWGWDYLESQQARCSQLSGKIPGQIQWCRLQTSFTCEYEALIPGIDAETGCYFTS